MIKLYFCSLTERNIRVNYKDVRGTCKNLGFYPYYSARLHIIVFVHFIKIVIFLNVQIVPNH